MSEAWRLIAENRIQEAFKAGEFKDLPGKGCPLDLTDYFNTPEQDRIGFSLLRNAGVLPPEIELLKEIEALQARLNALTDRNEQEKLQEQIQFRKLKATMAFQQRISPERNGKR